MAGTQSPSAACVCMEGGHEYQTILVYRILAVGLVCICQHSLLLCSTRYLVNQMTTAQEIAIDINTKLRARSCGGAVRIAETGPVFDGRQALLPWGSPTTAELPKLRKNHNWFQGTKNEQATLAFTQERLELKLSHRVADQDFEHCCYCRVSRARWQLFSGEFTAYLYVDKDCDLISDHRPSCSGIRS